MSKVIFGLFLVFFVTSSSWAANLTPDIIFSDETPEALPDTNSWQYGNGDTYRGGWREGKPHGSGLYRRANGEVYQGQFEQGFFHGQGTYRFRNGDVYSGQWVNGHMSGQGEMHYQNGNHYVGHWSDGQRQGSGKLTYPSGTLYEGTWVEGEKMGYGLTVYSNSDRYLGAYKDNRPHGHGVKTLANGDVYRGTFSRGVPHGVGECKYPNTETFVCLFDRGEQIHDPEMLARAQKYLDKRLASRTFKGGIAYALQDQFTNDQYYLKTENVWWEKKESLLETQLRIYSKDARHFLYMIVDEYTGPGEYQLKKGDIIASTQNGDVIELPDDVIAQVKITEEKDGQIKGSFDIPALASTETDSGYRILDGQFEARNDPPDEVVDKRFFRR